MKDRLLMVCAVLLAVLILASVNPAAAAVKTHDLTATVVAVDIQAKKITYQDDAGTTSTAPVLDKAVESLKAVKAGEKVVLTCRDNEKGGHEGVIAIRPVETDKANER